jgi:4-hydroxybenzoate polyprenyltransferase
LTTSSKTSTNSSTPERAGGPAGIGSRATEARWLGGARLVHPFPSLLNAGATAIFALLAGGTGETAIGLAATMAALQASIGAVNDVVDAGADERTKPAKPIPARLVSRQAAVVVAVVAGAVGIGLASRFGPPAMLVAGLGYGLGLAYDLRLKRSRWSWLAYALALPLVPAFAWLGAAASLPPHFAWLAALALLGGVALALANGLVDVEGDAIAGTAGLAGALGRSAAWRLIAVCQAVLVVSAFVTSIWLNLRPNPAAWLVMVTAGGALALGVALSRDDRLARRQLGWELQAAGVGLLAAGWFAAQLTGG